MRNKILLIGATILLFILVLAMNITLSTIQKNNNMNKTSNKQMNIEKEERKTCEHEDTTFCSHLPLVFLETKGQIIQKEQVIWGKLSIIDNKETYNHIEDEPDIQVDTTIKYRGNSSYSNFDKKQYRLEFFKKAKGNKKKESSVMGMDKDCDWVLYGPFLDRSLIRNYLMYGVSREIMDWAPDSRYCEVFMDGNYQGLYLMVETVKVSENRINLKDFSLLNGETAYLVNREREGTEANTIDTFGNYAHKTFHELSIRYPSESQLLDTQKEWIRRDLSHFERVLYSNQFDNETNGYAALIDVNSFVDYYIINEFSMIRDASYLSTNVYKDLNGKLKMAVWDFNNGFDHYPWFSTDPYHFYVAQNNWYDRLFQDKNFTKKVITRYRELRKGVLSDESLLKKIDDTTLYLGEAKDRNFEVWGYTFYESLLSDGTDPTSYEEAISQLKTCIVERGKFLDKHIDSLYQYAIND